MFTLVVDDCGVKYIDTENFEHPRNALKDLYEITVDMTGSKHLGLTINWNYEKGHVDISMSGYVQKALHRYQHVPTKKQNSPFPTPRPIYGRDQKMRSPLGTLGGSNYM